MKPSMFKQIAAAVVMGTSKVLEDTGIAKATTPPTIQPSEEAKQSDMLSFAQHIARTYGGDSFDTKAAAKAVENEKAFAAQNTARCPNCKVLLEMGPIGAQDECAACHTWLEVVHLSDRDVPRFAIRKRPLL